MLTKENGRNSSIWEIGEKLFMKESNWVWRHREAVHEGINPREESLKEKALGFEKLMKKGEN